MMVVFWGLKVGEKWEGHKGGIQPNSNIYHPFSRFDRPTHTTPLHLLTGVMQHPRCDTTDRDGFTLRCGIATSRKPTTTAHISYCVADRIILKYRLDQVRWFNSNAQRHTRPTGPTQFPIVECAVRNSSSTNE